MIVIGTSHLARAVANICSRELVPEQSLVTGEFWRPSPELKPLLRCRFVIQVIAPNETESSTLWHHRAFWEMYGKLGGTDRRARGLRWCIVCEDVVRMKIVFTKAFGVDAQEQLNKMGWVSHVEGLTGLLDASTQAQPIFYHDWAYNQQQNLEFNAQRKLSALLLSTENPTETRQQVLALRDEISDYAWEAVCPPPHSHSLANSIRAWLKDPMTDHVTLWLKTGQDLIKKTNL